MVDDRKNPSMAVDMKYCGIVRRISDSTILPQDQMIVFNAADNAVPKMLEEYLRECERIGCGEDHLLRVGELIERAQRWRAANPDICKIPD